MPEKNKTNVFKLHLILIISLGVFLLFISTLPVSAAVLPISSIGELNGASSAVVSIPSPAGELWTKGQICEFMKGCHNSENDECYPYGYRMNDKYCGLDKTVTWTSGRFKIQNQSESHSYCDNSFECKSNFCFNQRCVGAIDSLIINLISRVNVLENKLNNFKEVSNKGQEIQFSNTSSLKTESDNKNGIVKFFKNLI